MPTTTIPPNSRTRIRILPRGRLGYKMIKLLSIAFLFSTFLFLVLDEAAHLASNSKLQQHISTHELLRLQRRRLEEKKTEPPVLHKRNNTQRRAYASTTWSKHSQVLNSHLYLPSGLLEANTSPNSIRRHPIHELINRSQTAWRLKLANQSTTLLDATNEYRRGYSREPPLGSETWWAYARKPRAQLPDEYNQMWRDVEVFWGFDV
ncbi:hypothetical protein AAF712_010701 [Marasmius tenuissimus]|uniref:Uncharacterized protein n=1 Tax=Marasmius tenuissimus TaxID=585030 RepID=A0ABR2ZMM3_9AGAR